jgi:hypothetical protein
MEKELFEQILRQQVYLLKRIEILEHKLGFNNRSLADDQIYFDELIRESKKIRIKTGE